jgi:energy-converting hydrogenase B subunit D
MNFPLEWLIYCFLIVSALLALEVRNLLTAVVSLTVFSFMCAILLAYQGAVDVGFTEATVGAGITGVLYVILLNKTSRKTRP